jgi:hypothetical protein
VFVKASPIIDYLLSVSKEDQQWSYDQIYAKYAFWDKPLDVHLFSFFFSMFVLVVIGCPK